MTMKLVDMEGDLYFDENWNVILYICSALFTDFRFFDHSSAAAGNVNGNVNPLYELFDLLFPNNGQL